MPESSTGPATPLRRPELRSLAKGLGLLLGLAGLGWTVRALGLDALVTERWIDAEVRGHGPSGVLLYLGVSCLLIAAGLPRQVFCFLGGYAFGLAAGAMWSVTASALGGLLAYAYARLLGGGSVARLLGRRLGRRIGPFEEFLRREPFGSMLVLRLLPVGNNLLTNLLAGASGLPLAAFLVGSTLGQLPQTAIFVLLGSGIHVQQGLRIGVSALLLAASTLLGYRLYGRYRQVAELARAEEGEAGRDDDRGGREAP